MVSRLQSVSGIALENTPQAEVAHFDSSLASTSGEESTVKFDRNRIIGRVVAAVLGNFYPRDSGIHAAIMKGSRELCIRHPECKGM